MKSLQLLLTALVLSAAIPARPSLIAQDSNSFYFPQIAVGGGYTTTVTLVNTGQVDADGDLQLTAGDGTPLSVLIEGLASEPHWSGAGIEATGSSFPISVRSGGTLILMLQALAASDPTVTGWGSVTYSSGLLGGVATIELRQVGMIQTVAGVLASRPVDNIIIPIDNDEDMGHFVGYAVANPGSTEVALQILIKNEQGETIQVLQPEVLELGPGQHVSRFVHQDLAAVLDFRGSLCLTALTGDRFIVVALIQNQQLLSALPVGMVSSDSVLLPEGAGATHGLLVDGQTGGSFVNDVVFTSAPQSNLLRIGNFVQSSGEIIAFADDRAPTLSPAVSWSDDHDLVSILNEPPYRIPFYVWIVSGPFDSQRSKVEDAMMTTLQIWTDERQGIQFSSFDIMDATADPDVSSFSAFTCSQAADMRARIGFNPGGVNVYYVDTVNFGSGPATTNGVWCGNATIAMGRNGSSHLFTHEAGHGFALGHTNTIPEFFDRSNVMHNASSRRMYLTEGQTFRAVVQVNSVINMLYQARPGLVVRFCSNSTSSLNRDCPPVQLRIWDDGPDWPATASAQATEPTDRAVQALDRFLNVDCEVDESFGVLSELMQWGPVLEPELIDILERGPEDSARIVRYRRRGAPPRINGTISLNGTPPCALPPTQLACIPLRIVLRMQPGLSSDSYSAIEKRPPWASVSSACPMVYARCGR